MNPEIITWFEVNDSGTIRYANFAESSKRSDYYYVYENDLSTPAQLISETDKCQPLAWHIGDLYSAYREDTAHPERLLTLPEEPEDGWKDWVLKMDEQAFDRLTDSIMAWFDAEPDWTYEEDYIPDRATAQGAALAYFNDERELCQQLGIKIVDGEYPGSSYYAAELRGTVEAANAAAESAGLAIRFRREA
jgi:hypothetical protein